MAEVELCRTVAAPVQRVWDVFTDLDRAAEYLSSVDRVDVLTPGGFKVGATWRATRVAPGRTAVEQLTVTLCEPPERCLVESRSRGNHYRTEFVFSPENGAKTLVTLRFGVESYGVGKVVGALRSNRDRPFAKFLQQDLDDLAEAAEKPE